MTEWSKGAQMVNGLVPHRNLPPKNDRLTDIYQAMMIGVRDYVNKNRFPRCDHRYVRRC